MVTNDESTRYMTNLQSPQIYQSGSGGGKGSLCYSLLYIFIFKFSSHASRLYYLFNFWSSLILVGTVQVKDSWVEGRFKLVCLQLKALCLSLLACRQERVSGKCTLRLKLFTHYTSVALPQNTCSPILYFDTPNWPLSFNNPKISSITFFLFISSLSLFVICEVFCCLTTECCYTAGFKRSPELSPLFFFSPFLLTGNQTSVVQLLTCIIIIIISLASSIIKLVSENW